MIKRSVSICLLLLFLWGIISLFTCAYAQGKVSEKNKATIGQWAENPSMKIQVTKIEEIKEWGSFPFSKRATPAKLKDLKGVKNAIDKGKAKFIMVSLEAKNIDDHPYNIGYYRVPASSGDFWLRGDEGSEQSSTQSNQFRDDIDTYVYNAKDLGKLIEGGFPERAKISPGGVAKGKMMFLVPVWFTPKVFFKKADYGDKRYELIIKLK